MWVSTDFEVLVLGCSWFYECYRNLIWGLGVWAHFIFFFRYMIHFPAGYFKIFFISIEI